MSTDHVPGLFVVVGIGADGWDGLTPAARRELESARTVYGSQRQLDLLPASVSATRIQWRSPMSEHLADVTAAETSEPVHLLASGDPMFHGLGASLVRTVGAHRVRVLSAPSSVSLAASRLGWDLASATVMSLVTAPLESMVGHLTDGARLLVLSTDASTPEAVAHLLCEYGYGGSSLAVLSDLGAPDEHILWGNADGWRGTSSALNIVAVECAGPPRSRAPGRADDAYLNDGQLSKRPVRVLSVSVLEPAEGQCLWDIGAGSGSIGIEWLATLRTGHVVAFEADPQRAVNVVENARRHGVVDRIEVRAGVPAALADAPRPNSVFIGGGMSVEVLDAAWNALLPGGRIVVNAVTIETERIVDQASRRWGGDMVRIGIEYAAPLGGSTAWRPALPIVQWTAVKP